MKEKPNRQAHKATNTFTFKKFNEKVRGLRVSARKFLLQRAQSADTDQTSVFHQTFLKCKELNLTEAFQVHPSPSGPNLSTSLLSSILFPIPSALFALPVLLFLTSLSLVSYKYFVIYLW